MTDASKKELASTEQNKAVSVQEDSVKKTGLMRGARDFIENTFAGLKGKDIAQAVEDFTTEMTIVAEGLSADQAALRRELDEVSALLTLLEEKQTRSDAAFEEATKTLKDRAEKQTKQLEKLEKQLESKEKAPAKPRKAGLLEVLKQSTWLVGLFCAAWVLVTLLKLFGG